MLGHKYGLAPRTFCLAVGFVSQRNVLAVTRGANPDRSPAVDLKMMTREYPTVLFASRSSITTSPAPLIILAPKVDPLTLAQIVRPGQINVVFNERRVISRSQTVLQIDTQDRVNEIGGHSGARVQVEKCTYGGALSQIPLAVKPIEQRVAVESIWRQELSVFGSHSKLHIQALSPNMSSSLTSISFQA